jgi:uncharacterized protein YlxP (DUF503 family)
MVGHLYNVWRSVEGREAVFIAIARMTLALQSGARKTVSHRIGDKLRHRFGASVADVEPNGPGDRVTVGISLVSSNRKKAEADLQAMTDFVRREIDEHVVEELAEVFSFAELAAIGEPTLADVEGLKRGIHDSADERRKQQLLSELRANRKRREEDE